MAASRYKTHQTLRKWFKTGVSIGSFFFTSYLLPAAYATTLSFVIWHQCITILLNFSSPFEG